jgi:hypothetical protein
MRFTGGRAVDSAKIVAIYGIYLRLKARDVAAAGWMHCPPSVEIDKLLQLEANPDINRAADVQLLYHASSSFFCRS